MLRTLFTSVVVIAAMAAQASAVKVTPSTEERQNAKQNAGDIVDPRTGLVTQTANTGKSIAQRVKDREYLEAAVRDREGARTRDQV